MFMLKPSFAIYHFDVIYFAIKLVKCNNIYLKTKAKSTLIRERSEYADRLRASSCDSPMKMAPLPSVWKFCTRYLKEHWPASGIIKVADIFKE
jgi:hypothetical protein